MDVDGRCWPSLAAISRRASLKGRATVCRHLKKLEDAKFLQRDKGGPGRSTRYQGLSLGSDYMVSGERLGGISRETQVVSGEIHEVSSRSSSKKFAYKADWEKPNPEPQRRSEEKCKVCGLFAKHALWCGDVQLQADQVVVAEVAQSEEEVPVVE
jgi:hypothetical protein